MGIYTCIYIHISLSTELDPVDVVSICLAIWVLCKQLIGSGLLAPFRSWTILSHSIPSFASIPASGFQSMWQRKRHKRLLHTSWSCRIHFVWKGWRTTSLPNESPQVAGLSGGGNVILGAWIEPGTPRPFVMMAGCLWRGCHRHTLWFTGQHIHSASSSSWHILAHISCPSLAIYPSIGFNFCPSAFANSLSSVVFS